jgi:probable HAF family extracellular repeat protein
MQFSSWQCLFGFNGPREQRRTQKCTRTKPILERLEDRCLLSNYAITDLGTLGGSRSAANSINQNGQVVGWSDTTTSTDAFLWQDGKMTDLGTLGGSGSIAYGVNALGQVVGSADTNSAGHAFLWQGGAMNDLGTLGGSSSTARSINGSSQIVGTSDSASGYSHAFLWQSGAMTDLGTLGSSTAASYATSINATGQIVGYSDDNQSVAFLWQHGAMAPLSGLFGGNNSVANQINDSGQVAGTIDSTRVVAEPHGTAGYLVGSAFLWQNGRMTSLGTLPGFGDISFGVGINSSGQVVGSSAYHVIHSYQRSRTTYYYWTTYVEEAFSWQSGKMTDLNSLVPAGSGWDLSSAYGINDAGQIVGSGTLNGQFHGFLLTPISGGHSSKSQKQVQPVGKVQTTPAITRPASMSFLDDRLPVTYVVVDRTGVLVETDSLRSSPWVPTGTSLAPALVAIGEHDPSRLAAHGAALPAVPKLQDDRLFATFDGSQFPESLAEDLVLARS